MKVDRKVVATTRFVDTMETSVTFDYVESGLLQVAMERSRETVRGAMRLSDEHIAKWDKSKITIIQLTEEEK